MGFDDSRRPGFDHWVSFRGQGTYLDHVVNVDDLRSDPRETRNLVDDPAAREGLTRMRGELERLVRAAR